MKLGLSLGYSGARMHIDMDGILHAETLGFDSVWFAESWGSDAVTPAAWVLAQTKTIKAGTAIMQMPARTPACAAMTAITLQQLSGNRFILGLGASGPQVIEGWHGVPYGRPITRTREYIQVVRQILARQGPLEFAGKEYQIPYQGEGSSGLGKPLKSIIHGDPSLPIYTAAITDNGIRCAAQYADGFFPVWMNPDRYDIFKPAIEEGFAKADQEKSLDSFDIAPFIQVVMGDDLERCRQPVRAMLALYVGGMGARNKNFYNDYAVRLGYEAEAREIQDLYLTGKPREAAARVPAQLIDDVSLVGSADRIRDGLGRWSDAGKRGEVQSMLLQSNSTQALNLLAEQLL
jgi:F420-dependent oxidoreductase-like protein